MVDADTGYGNALNVQRTVRALERAGASAIQLEDQDFPKRCGHLDGKALVSAAEMAGKVRAAVDARRSDATLIVARTDAVAVEGFERAIERAALYAQAGADLLFVEAPKTRDELGRVVAALGQSVPLMANMVEGGKTPILPAAELEALGFALVIFPGGIVRALAKTATEYYASLAAHGTTEPFRARMLDFAATQRARRDARDAGTRQALRRRGAGRRHRKQGRTQAMTLDPVTLAVLNGRLVQIADEMDATLYRSAFNPIIAEAHDACHGLYHAETGATLVQGTSGLPIFVGAMAFAVKAVIDKVARDGALDAGDIYLFNDPYDGGTHLNDFRLVRPVMRERQGVRLARLGRPLARRRRQCAGQLQRQGDRELPGGLPRPSGETRPRGRAAARHRRHPRRQLARAAVELGRPQRPAQRDRARRRAGCTRCSTSTATRPSRQRSKH